mmetsp:Transcript_7441/g.31541  ORF Transcript_7441/g.31541 Transcript_7441/m.31541 type:complete len:250 (+) Transcript_7441:1132-1881(+)
MQRGQALLVHHVRVDLVRAEERNDDIQVTPLCCTVQRCPAIGVNRVDVHLQGQLLADSLQLVLASSAMQSSLSEGVALVTACQGEKRLVFLAELVLHVRQAVRVAAARRNLLHDLPPVLGPQLSNAVRTRSINDEHSGLEVIYEHCVDCLVPDLRLQRAAHETALEGDRDARPLYLEDAVVLATSEAGGDGVLEVGEGLGQFGRRGVPADVLDDIPEESLVLENVSVVALLELVYLDVHVARPVLAVGE